MVFGAGYSHLPSFVCASLVSAKVFKLVWHVLQLTSPPAAFAFLTTPFINFFAALRPPSVHAALTLSNLKDFAAHGVTAGGSSVARAGSGEARPAKAATERTTRSERDCKG